MPITAPWAQMNLPVKENAVVWASNDKQLKVVHRDGKQKILGDYTDALKADGWQLVDFQQPTDRYVVTMKKGADNLEMEIYDFHNTGVIIELK